MFKLYIKSFFLIVIAIVILKLVDSLIIHDELLHYNIEKLKEENTSYDFIYLGNSLTRRSYNAPFIDSTLNTKSICLASEAQHFYITNSIFEDLVKNKSLDKNKVLIITLSPWQFKSLDEQKWWHFLQMSALDELNLSSNYFKNINEFYSYSDYPKVFSTTIRFHNEIPSQIAQTTNKLKLFNKTNPNGFVLGITPKLSSSQREQKKDINTFIDSYNEGVTDSKSEKISEEADEIIINIIDKCRELGTKLIFITPPSIDALYNKSEFGKRKYIQELLENNNTSYIDFNKIFKKLNLTFDDFNDFAHLNKSGNQKLAPFIADTLSNLLNLQSSKSIEVKQEKLTVVTDTLKESISTTNLANETLAFNKWGKVGVIAEQVNGNEILITRDNVSKASFAYTKEIPVEYGKIYKASIQTKTFNADSYIGMRILGKYPNRVDAIFDIKNKKVLGVKASGSFSLANASIDISEDNNIVCKIESKVTSERVKILIGPTSNKNKVQSWEAASEFKNDIIIIPSSLIFENIRN